MKSVPTIVELFQDYRKQLDTDNDFTASVIRKDLVRRILKEVRNPFDNPLYTLLLEEENSPEINKERKTAQLMNLTPLMKAWLYKNGTRDYAPEVIMEECYLTVGDTSLFGIHLIRWTFLQFLGLDDSDCKDRMLNKASIRTALEVIDTINTESADRILNYSREVLDPLFSDPNNDESARDMVRACLVLFLLFYRLGDEVNSKYYLMKAAQLNYPDNETEMLILFLENVLLL